MDTIVVDIFYAQRRGERFSEEALQRWGHNGAFRHVAGFKFDKATEVGTPEQMAITLAETLFEHTNLTPEWWLGSAVFRNYTDGTADTCRSMCVGDVVQVIFTGLNMEVTLGCTSVGFRPIANRRTA